MVRKQCWRKITQDDAILCVCPEIAVVPNTFVEPNERAFCLGQLLSISLTVLFDFFILTLLTKKNKKTKYYNVTFKLHNNTDNE